MKLSHPLFQELEYDDYGGYKTKAVFPFSGKEGEVDLILSETFGNGGIEPGHCTAYEALLAGWQTIVPEVLYAILSYQNDEWGATDHTQSFPKFQTVEDVLEYTAFIGITLHACSPDYLGARGRYAVLLFHAEWVNNDYRLLSVALLNEKVVEVSDQEL